MSKKIKRESKIKMVLTDRNAFNLYNTNDELLLGKDDDYFIYFKNANFKSDGVLEGRFLGYASESIFDGYCRNVTHENGKFTVDGKVVKTARMVAVSNKDKTVIIIDNN